MAEVQKDSPGKGTDHFTRSQSNGESYRNSKLKTRSKDQNGLVHRTTKKTRNTGKTRGLAGMLVADDQDELARGRRRQTLYT